MTKSELVSLVEQAYATYRLELPVVEEQQVAVYMAWGDLLLDLEYESCRRALVDIAVHSAFMPRPGEIRKAAINTSNKIPPFDDPNYAWGIWMTISREVSSGTPPSITPSEALVKTVHILGEAAYGMHTNGDREAFCSVYRQVVAEIESERYRVAELPERRLKKNTPT